MLNETGINPLTLTWDAAAIMTRDDLFWDTVPNKPPIPLDLCVAVPISCLPMQSVLNVKALVGAVNQGRTPWLWNLREPLLRALFYQIYSVVKMIACGELVITSLLVTTPGDHSLQHCHQHKSHRSRLWETAPAPPGHIVSACWVS